MKKITCLLPILSFVITCFAQRKTDGILKAEPKIIPPLTKSTSSTLTQGKDLTITIDRLEDESSTDINKYLVHYTAKNNGTVDLNLPYIQVQIQCTFHKTIQNPDGSSYEVNKPGGSSLLNLNGNPIFASGQTIQGSIEVSSRELLTNQTYDLLLTIDNTHHITEENEQNNSSAVTVTAKAIKDAEYYLASAKINITTGNDNKEANNSVVDIYVGPANYNEKVYYQLTGLKSELPANSTTGLILNKRLVSIDSYNTLCFYKQRGLALTIIYNNNAFATDAWKINNISVTLTFKDKNGNIYPDASFASKTINFNNINGVLGYRPGDDIFSNLLQYRALTIATGPDFEPLQFPYQFDKSSTNKFSVLYQRSSPTYNKWGFSYCD